MNSHAPALGFDESDHGLWPSGIGSTEGVGNACYRHRTEKCDLICCRPRRNRSCHRSIRAGLRRGQRLVRPARAHELCCPRDRLRQSTTAEHRDMSLRVARSFGSALPAPWAAGRAAVGPRSRLYQQARGLVLPFKPPEQGRRSPEACVVKRVRFLRSNVGNPPTQNSSSSR